MKNDFCENPVRGAIEILKNKSCFSCSELKYKFSELINKDVVNLCDGCRIGCVCDLLIECNCGKIEALIVPLPHKIFEKCKYKQIPWEQVERIGKDTIIVRVPKDK